MAKQKKHDGPCGDWREWSVATPSSTRQTQTRECGKEGCHNEQSRERTRRNPNDSWGGWSGWR